LNTSTEVVRSRVLGNRPEVRVVRSLAILEVGVMGTFVPPCITVAETNRRHSHGGSRRENVAAHLRGGDDCAPSSTVMVALILACYLHFLDRD
jgi:hypothetical protein